MRNYQPDDESARGHRITGLSRIKWLFVIASNSTFSYKEQPVDVKRVLRLTLISE